MAAPAPTRRLFRRDDATDDEPTPRTPRAVTFGPCRAVTPPTPAAVDETSGTLVVRRPVSLPSDAFSLLEAPNVETDSGLDDDSAVATVLRLPPRLWVAPSSPRIHPLLALWRRAPWTPVHAAMVAAAVVVVFVALATTPRVEPLVYEDGVSAPAERDARAFIVDDLAAPFVAAPLPSRSTATGSPAIARPAPRPRSLRRERPSAPVVVVAAAAAAPERAPVPLERAPAPPPRRSFRRVFTAGATP